MTLTVSNVLQAGYRRLGQLNVGKATGGSVSTVIDTTLIGKSKDNVWNDGALFILRHAAGAAPQNEFQRISGYINATGVFTVDTVFSASPVVTDVYAYASGYYPLQQMIQSLNDALFNLGTIDLVDTTTLTVLTNTTEYAASVAWKSAKPYRIDIQGRVGVAADNQWREFNDFQFVPTAPGVAGKIIFNGYPLVGRAVRIWYNDNHPTVYTFSDPISEVFFPDTVVKAFVAEALMWQNNRSQGAEPYLVQAGTKAEQMLENSKVANPMYRVKARPKLLIMGHGEPDNGRDNFTYPLPP